MGFAVVSFMIALLSGMGVGSGGLLVVYLTLVENLSQLQAQGINLLFFIFSAGASTAVNFRAGDVYTGALLAAGAGGIAGAVVGAFLSAIVSPALLRRFFGVMLVYSGLKSLFGVFVRRKKDMAGKVTDEIYH